MQSRNQAATTFVVLVNLTAEILNLHLIQADKATDAFQRMVHAYHSLLELAR